MRYTSSDGLLSSSDPKAIVLWEGIVARQENAKADWTSRLRAMGVKLAHPDDGWVNRERCTFHLSWYAQFDDRPEVGDLIAFGTPPRPTRWDPEGRYYEPSRVWDGRTYGRAIAVPEHAMSGYRICRVVTVTRRSSILGYFQDFTYEDTGDRVPARKPAPVSWFRRLFRRS